MKSEKAKKVFLVFSLIFLAVVLVLVYLSTNSLSEEEKIIELSKKAFNKYASDYDYHESSENWLVSFNDYDGDGTITVWAPSDDGLCGCVMFERRSDGIVAFFVEVNHEERYRIERENDSISTPKDEILADASDDTEPLAEGYPEIVELFSSAVPDSEVSVKLRNGKTLHTKIMTQFPSKSAPDGWEDTLAALGEALAAADEKKEEYGASVASAELYSADNVILASGFESAVQFDKFKERDLGEEVKTNPPTISRFEYDQIAVGMTLSQVREIVGGDGTLDSSIGDVLTYHFPGEKEGSYASVLFDDYVVYSKSQIFLE